MRPSEHANTTFKRRAAELVGRRIQAVRYVDLVASDEQEWAGRGDRFHTPEIGVDLDLDDGQTVALTWSVKSMGLECLQGSLVHVLSDPGIWATWDVSSRPEWATHLGVEIVQVEVRTEQGGIGDPATIPLCLALSFGPDDRIYICAARYSTDHARVFFDDGIAIFFREDMVRHYYPDLLLR